MRAKPNLGMPVFLHVAPVRMQMLAVFEPGNEKNTPKNAMLSTIE
jgi:hypothetical protein